MVENRSFDILGVKGNHCDLLTAYGTSHFNTSWSPDTSTPETDSTANLIDLTCSLTTFSELSEATLNSGLPSADVSYTTSPVQTNFTALRNARMEGSLSHRNNTVVSQIVQILKNHLHHLPVTWEINSFRRKKSEQKTTWWLHRESPRLHCLHAVPLPLHCLGFWLQAEKRIPRHDWDLLSTTSLDTLALPVTTSSSMSQDVGSDGMFRCRDSRHPRRIRHC